MPRLCGTETPIFKYYERRLGVMKQILGEAEADGGIDRDVTIETREEY